MFVLHDYNNAIKMQSEQSTETNHATTIANQQTNEGKTRHHMPKRSEKSQTEWKWKRNSQILKSERDKTDEMKWREEKTKKTDWM